VVGLGGVGEGGGVFGVGGGLGGGWGWGGLGWGRGGGPGVRLFWGVGRTLVLPLGSQHTKKKSDFHHVIRGGQGTTTHGNSNDVEKTKDLRRKEKGDTG